MTIDNGKALHKETNEVNEMNRADNQANDGALVKMLEEYHGSFGKGKIGTMEEKSDANGSMKSEKSKDEELAKALKKMLAEPPERSCVQLDSGKVACGTYLGPQVESGNRKPQPEIIFK